MRKPIIAGNWKMNKTNKEAVALAKELKKSLKGIKNREIVVCPPFTALSDVAKELKGSNIGLGAQNAYCEEQGAFTGEVSVSMLKEIGVKYVIIGHSERREHFKETNELINKKVKNALKNGLKPILCVGEKLLEREAGETERIVENHISNGLKSLTKKDVLNCVIAYEPVWAIGTGRTATPAQAEEVHVFIRKLLEKMFDKETAGKVRIQYGGSVKPDNIKELMAKENIDGALVGGASLDANSFTKIVRF